MSKVKMEMRKEVPIALDVYERLEQRSQHLGLTVNQYVDKLFNEMDQTPPTVETIIVTVEMAKGLYEQVKQFVETSGLAYSSITEFIEEATRSHLLHVERLRQ